MSRNAKQFASMIARAMSVESWFIDSPANVPRRESFHRGAMEPVSAGMKRTPRAPGSERAARSKNSCWLTPRTFWANHSVLPPETKPGFSIR